MITFPRECHAPVSLPPDRPLTRRLRSARNHAQRLTYSRFITHISTQIFVRALCQLGPIHFCARTHLKVGCTVSLPHAKHNCAEVKLHLCALVHQDWLADASAAPSNDFACGTHSSNRLRQLTWRNATVHKSSRLLSEWRRSHAHSDHLVAAGGTAGSSSAAGNDAPDAQNGDTEAPFNNYTISAAIGFRRVGDF